MPEQYPDVITIGEAARILCVDTETLRRWDNTGKLVALRTLGNQRRYLRATIEALLVHPITDEVAS